MNRALAFGCGLLFALGLGLSGMTQPAKVTGFLDVTGAWDPSLAFVMAGALAVFAPAYWLSRRRAVAASERGLDARLVGGAALFGLGWGLSGFCPGPAIVSLGGASRAALVFVPAMLLGMAIHAFVARTAGAEAAETNCG